MSAAPPPPGPALGDGAPSATSAPVAGSGPSSSPPPPPAAYARTVVELAVAGIVEVPRASLRSVAAAAGKRGWRVRGINFEVDARYFLLRVLGTGSYGMVVAAWDAVTGVVVAIKRVARIFDDVVEARRILREIRLMRSMRHDALLGLIDVDVPALDTWDAWHDVYLVSLQMDRDLHRVLRSPVPLTDAHCRFFAWQLLAGVKYMHSANILHRDLKVRGVNRAGHVRGLVGGRVVKMAKRARKPAGCWTHGLCLFYCSPHLMRFLSALFRPLPPVRSRF